MRATQGYFSRTLRSAQNFRFTVRVHSTIASPMYRRTLRSPVQLRATESQKPHWPHPDAPGNSYLVFRCTARQSVNGTQAWISH
ncbi:hypothetical protein BH09PLA1_BH09PLA1_21940 [soil metagenome]